MILKPRPPLTKYEPETITSDVKLWSLMTDTNQVHDPLIVWNHLCVHARVWGHQWMFSVTAKEESNVEVSSAAKSNGSVVSNNLETVESLDWKRLMVEDPNYEPIWFFLIAFLSYIYHFYCVYKLNHCVELQSRCYGL